MKLLEISVNALRGNAHFTFFVCAKKVTKKAQPILMHDNSPAEHVIGQNRALRA